MRIAIATNSFKGSLTASEAADGIERGIKKAWPRAVIIKIPVADGGDGTARTLIKATGGKWINRNVKDPLGRKIRSGFGLIHHGRTAVIEMAMASGLVLLDPRERNPLNTSTDGTGELIAAALEHGVSEILIGIGGSATNDGGMGLARQLGVKFLNRAGVELKGGGGELSALASINMSGLDARLKGVRIYIACDVDNPLYGPRGAAHRYGPQKGATPRMAAELDRGLKRLAAVIKKDIGRDVAKIPGAGAAGGLGAGAIAFLDAQLRRGADLVVDALQLEKKIKGCDLVITGEGRLDGQTVNGKAPAAVARVANSLGIPVIAICGSLGPDAGKTQAAGIDACFSALEQNVEETQLGRFAPGMLERCSEQVGRLLALSPKIFRK